MAELKTKVNDASVEDFLNGIEDETRRADAFEILRLMKSVTRKPPRMWGPSIVGFGQYHYKYASGHEGDMCIIGFSPRAQAFTLYMYAGVGPHEALLDKLGKHSSGKGCLYIKRLTDVDTRVLRQLISASYRHMRETYGQRKKHDKS
jgi:hypothetical protein